MVGRYYEAIADRRWPVCTEGIAVDISGVCASIQDFLGPHLERYNQAGAGANPVGIFRGMQPIAVLVYGQLKLEELTQVEVA